MDRRFKEQLAIALIILAFLFTMGTIIFYVAEDWSWLDSFYYTGITLTTIGFGDLVPSHAFTKIATVVFGILGIGLVFYSANLIARKAFEQEADNIEAILHRRLQRKLAEEKKAKEEAEREAVRKEQEVVKKAKEVEKEAVEIAKELTGKKPKKSSPEKTAKKGKKK